MWLFAVGRGGLQPFSTPVIVLDQLARRTGAPKTARDTTLRQAAYIRGPQWSRLSHDGWQDRNSRRIGAVHRDSPRAFQGKPARARLFQPVPRRPARWFWSIRRRVPQQ